MYNVPCHCLCRVVVIVGLSLSLTSASIYRKNDSHITQWHKRTVKTGLPPPQNHNSTLEWQLQWCWCELLFCSRCPKTDHIPAVSFGQNAQQQKNKVKINDFLRTVSPCLQHILADSARWLEVKMYMTKMKLWHTFLGVQVMKTNHMNKTMVIPLFSCTHRVEQQ